MTQAQTGTGYFKVKRDAVEGPDTPDLCIPFHAVREVTAGHGVVLNDTFVSGLGSNEHPEANDTAAPSSSSPSRWGKWLSRKKA